jgi:8-oxo-dGTP pyrophosphatase MutT (NUDIX family)
MKLKDGAKTFIKNNKLGKYLFVLRDDKPNIPNPNCWGLIGGGIEKGEEPIEALKREVKEEIGIELYDIKKLGVIEVPLTVKGKTKTMLGHTFLAYIDAEIKDIELKEGQRVEYFTLDDIQKQKNLSSGAVSRIKEFRDLLE